MKNRGYILNFSFSENIGILFLIFELRKIKLISLIFQISKFLPLSLEMSKFFLSSVKDAFSWRQLAWKRNSRRWSRRPLPRHFPILQLPKERLSRVEMRFNRSIQLQTWQAWRPFLQYEIRRISRFLFFLADPEDTCEGTVCRLEIEFMTQFVKVADVWSQGIF